MINKKLKQQIIQTHGKGLSKLLFQVINSCRDPQDKRLCIVPLASSTGAGIHKTLSSCGRKDRI
jgi:hypothetical protein